MDKALVLADRLKKLKDQVDSLATKQTEIQTIKGDQGPKGEQGDRGFDGAPGLDGRDGKNGTDGADGKDGVSVIKAEIAFDGSLVLYLSNGDQIDCGEVTPAKSKEVFQTIKNSGGSSPINIFTALLPGLVPASGGGTTNFLRADGSFAAPPTTAPAGATTQVQFNNAGAFGGSANFTYATGTNTFTVGPAGATTTIETLAPTGSTIAGTMLFRGKNASATNGAGGGITLRGGSSLGTGIGGGIEILGGQGVSGAGGGFRVIAGLGATGGGGFVLDAGGGATQGGGFTMNAGVCTGSSGAGGSFEMYAGGGSGASTGGDLVMGAGSSVTGAGGNFVFLTGGGATSGVMYFSDSVGHNVIQVTDDLTDGQLGFFDATPVAQQASAPVATNLATAITLVNALRTALLNLGLIV